MGSRSCYEFPAWCRGVGSVPAESLLVPLVIAHTGSRRAKPPHRVQSMPPERLLPAGAIFAPSEVTQPQFEAKIKGRDYFSA